MNNRDKQEPIPRDLTPSAAELAYLNVLNQIELRRLELKRIAMRERDIVEQIKSLEASAEFARNTAVES